MQLSVIIPVYNQWALTQACLKSLAATLAGDFFEVFVMDNASSDATAKECPPLGDALFGARFHYVRFEENRNFGPANNHAARMACGEYLLLLNNDVVLLPGWYQPLLDDFHTYPDTAATSPVLLFPQKGFLGHTIQHLGVHLTPQRRVNHLYNGMPADCPITRKRRFFQMITAACMMIPRKLFLDNGGFDEYYINGFEDVDLCARLHSQGWRFTVNPNSRVFHHTSQTPGRSANEYRNAIHLNNTTAKLLHPDLPRLLADDGILYTITPWLTWEMRLSAEETSRLEPLLATQNSDEMRAIMVENALWNDGYLHLMRLLLEKGDLPAAMQVWESMIKLFPRPENTLAMLEYLYQRDNRLLLQDHVDYMLSFCNTLLAYDEGCGEGLRAIEESIQADENREDANLIKAQLAGWRLLKSDILRQGMAPFFHAVSRLVAHDDMPLTRSNAYLLWKLSGRDDACLRSYGPPKKPETGSKTKFSIFLKVGTDHGHFLSSANSLKAQSYSTWEAFLLPTGSPGGDVIQSAAALSREDARFRNLLEERKFSGSPKTTSDEGDAPYLNTALSMASGDFVLVMENGDRVAPDALDHIAQTVGPETTLIMSDEDILTLSGNLARPLFKPSQWDANLLPSNLYPGRAVWLRREALAQAGGWREGFPGYEQFDMLLRYAEGLSAEQTLSLPKVLYHVREKATGKAKNQALEERRTGYGIRAVQQHLKRMGRKGKATRLLDMEAPEKARGVGQDQAVFSVRYALPAPAPVITLFVTDFSNLPEKQLHGCAEELIAGTNYPNLELVILREPTRLLPAMAEAKGDILALADAGYRPSSPSWLAELASSLLQTGVAAVGAALQGPEGQPEYLGYVNSHAGTLVPAVLPVPSTDVACLAPSTHEGDSARPAQVYAGLDVLPHRVAALDHRLLLLRKEDASALKGEPIGESAVGTVRFWCPEMPTRNGTHDGTLLMASNISFRRRPEIRPSATVDPAALPILPSQAAPHPYIPALRSLVEPPLLYWPPPDLLPDKGNGPLPETLLEDTPFKPDQT